MRRWIAMLLSRMMALGGPGQGQADVPDGAACGMAGQAAERAAALPAGLLLSIGLVESGRVNPLNGKITPWPWTVNADGVGHYFDSEADAAAYARLAQSSGAMDVDVGCFQISLRYHPEAFASLDQAFDPAANARYAAGFLSGLRTLTGSWGGAIADYHSAAPELGLPYRRRVLAAWQGLGGLGGLPAGLDLADAVDVAAADPVVIEEAPAARSVRVFTMDDPGAGEALRGLPRVISP